MNLIVKNGDELIFSHDGHWLHPLFALEDFLNEHDYSGESLFLKDKLIGRGAAILIHRMGIRSCHGLTVSSRALSYLNDTNVECSYDGLVDKLDCQTELILTDEMSNEDAYTELKRRAGRA